MYHQRSHNKEWMDLGYYSTEEYEDCLLKLEGIGRILGGNKATLHAFHKLNKDPQSILDVGCGGGASTFILAQQYPKAKVVGIDTAPEAIHYAQKQLREKYTHMDNVEFFIPPSPRLQYPPQSFDVITATLVCHHLTNDEIIQFLKDASLIARQAIIINDLHRHILATAAYKIVAPILFPNHMVVHDGLLSIKRAFHRNDWISYFQSADIPIHKTSLSWHWAFRWIAMIDTDQGSSNGK